jgi:hypothetical protein
LKRGRLPGRGANWFFRKAEKFRRRVTIVERNEE